MRIPLEWLKEYVAFDISPQALAQQLTLHGLEVPAIEGDVIDVDVLPNRGDCLSIRGVAREVSAILGRPMKKKKVVLPRTRSGQFPKVTVQVMNKKACPRYCARVIKNVKVGHSPDWLKNRLLQCGLRPINNVVDITNYILLELGQPMHAFDLNLIAEKKIVVRLARPGEKMVTIEGT
ncbi:MAG: phenylalanine--tRNA ligase beta subunit-related protein, partial [Candidatus Margulisiibacteriota bacterium]